MRGPTLETRLLEALRLEGGALHTLDLADRLGLPVTTTNNVLARLVRKGLVARCGKRRLPYHSALVTVWAVNREGPG